MNFGIRVATSALAAALAGGCAGAVHDSEGRGGDWSGPIWQFHCEGLSFAARFGDDRALLITADSLETLLQSRSASGARYTGDGTVLWNRGREAMLDRRGEHYADCQGMREPGPWSRARERGVDFRAAGNEPGWYLELDAGGDIHLVADYGEREARIPATEPERVPGATVYRAGGLELRIVRQPCRDSMRGDLWPARVVVSLDGAEWRGCGMFL